MPDPNPYCLTITVELDKPLGDEARTMATKLLASDISQHFTQDADGWGWGRARIVGVYPHVEVPR